MKNLIPFRRWLLVFLLTAMLGSAFSAGAVTGYLARPVLAADQPSEFAVFWEAWDIVLNHFVDRDRLDARRMTYGAIQGMLDSLGDQGHTAFFSPEAAQAESRALEGSFEGIGAYVDAEGEQVKIIAPIRGSPAEAAGLLAGDIILKVDGVEVTGLPQWEVIGMVRGPAGTTVTLTVLHPEASEPVDIAITRGRIAIASVDWARVPERDIVYVQITQFAANTADDLRKALEAIHAETDAGQPVAGLILDLRNNPGGLLSQALRTGNQFLPTGAIILNERNAQGRVSSYKSLGRGLARDLPMVALINEGSASAAEIIAGALQDNERAQLVGMTTVGTGTVLVPFTLSDGSLIRLGVTNWLTPNLRLIKGQGIEPDVMVSQEAGVTKVDAEALREAAEQQSFASDDLQFDAALMLLEGLVAEKS
ncbi:MAG: S41 family peptidase [Caldilineaceae bacterium]|nr:S41 family peptidase [Caldilineaceae bacterium]